MIKCFWDSLCTQFLIYVIHKSLSRHWVEVSNRENDEENTHRKEKKISNACSIWNQKTCVYFWLKIWLFALIYRSWFSLFFSAFVIFFRIAWLKSEFFERKSHWKWLNWINVSGRHWTVSTVMRDIRVVQMIRKANTKGTWFGWSWRHIAKKYEIQERKRREKKTQVMRIHFDRLLSWLSRWFPPLFLWRTYFSGSVLSITQHFFHSLPLSRALFLWFSFFLPSHYHTLEANKKKCSYEYFRSASAYIVIRSIWSLSIFFSHFLRNTAKFTTPPPTPNCIITGILWFMFNIPTGFPYIWTEKNERKRRQCQKLDRKSFKIGKE